jgi:hypothetical protein
MGKDKFTEKTKILAAKRVNFLCSYPECRCLTVSSSQEGNNKFSSIGEAAHICANSKGGKRYDKSMSSKERKSVDNCIWLCKTHARLIDTDENKYTVEVLRQWKKDTEEYVSKVVQDGLKKYENSMFLFEKWYDKFMIDKWDVITDYLLQPVPKMRLEIFNSFRESVIWLSKNIHLIKDNVLNESVSSFSSILTALLDEFEKYCEINNNLLITIPDRHDNYIYQNENEYNDHTDLIFELGFELTKSINYICNILRDTYSLACAKEKINLVYTCDIMEGYKSCIPEYLINENRVFNLEEFLKDNQKRLFKCV